MSEAGRDLLATLDLMQSPRRTPVPSPEIPRTPRIDAPAAAEETTPRAPTTPRTAFSRAWLDPFGAELDDVLPERVTGSGMVKKREMTPVEERTEGGASSLEVKGDEGRFTWIGASDSSPFRACDLSLAVGLGKPLPSTPSGSAASVSSPTKPPVKRATDLIAFFEHAASSPAAGKLKSGHARGGSEHLAVRDVPVEHTKGHVRAVSVPEDHFLYPLETPLERGSSELDTLIHPHDSASEVAFAPPPVLPTTTPHPTLPTEARKRDTSPLQNVRNVVAAWRGNLPSPQPLTAFNTPALRLATAGDERDGLKRGNVFEEAFFTIRRMSTRRRAKRPEESGSAPRREEGREKPLPLVIGEEAPEQRVVPGRAEAVRGNLVSTMTDMTSEVSFLRMISAARY